MTQADPEFEEPSPDVVPERDQGKESRPGVGYMPAGAQADDAVAQTAPVAVGSDEYRQWAQQASFQGLQDVGGQAAPPPGRPAGAKGGRASSPRWDEPSPDVVPERDQGEASRPGVGYIPAGAQADDAVAQTAPVAVGSDEYRQWAQQASFQGLKDVGGQAAPPPKAAQIERPPHGTLRPREGSGEQE